jgi:hypothetical protein
MRLKIAGQITRAAAQPANFDLGVFHSTAH